LSATVTKLAISQLLS